MNLVLKDRLSRFHGDWESLGGGAVFRLVILTKRGDHCTARRSFKTKTFVENERELDRKILALYFEARAYLESEFCGRLSREHLTLILRAITCDSKKSQMNFGTPAVIVDASPVLEYDVLRQAGDRLAVRYEV